MTKSPAHDYEVHDAYHTLRHARKIVGNKPLMKKVAAHAKNMAQEHHQVAQHATMLAKSGKISDGQMAKLRKMSSVA